MTKYLISVSWPKGAKGDDRCESTVEIDAANETIAWRQAEAKWPEHDVLAVTEAVLQPDGRWTFPEDHNTRVYRYNDILNRIERIKW